MDYELFNDAMCRLRQAEENLNLALRDIFVAINKVANKPGGPVFGSEVKDTEDDIK